MNSLKKLLKRFLAWSDDLFTEYADDFNLLVVENRIRELDRELCSITSIRSSEEIIKERDSFLEARKRLRALVDAHEIKQEQLVTQK